MSRAPPPRPLNIAMHIGALYNPSIPLPEHSKIAKQLTRIIIDDNNCSCILCDLANFSERSNYASFLNLLLIRIQIGGGVRRRCEFHGLVLQDRIRATRNDCSIKSTV